MASFSTTNSCTVCIGPLIHCHSRTSACFCVLRLPDPVVVCMERPRFGSGCCAKRQKGVKISEDGFVLEKLYEMEGSYTVKIHKLG